MLTGKIELASVVREFAKAAAPAEDPSKNSVVLETTTEPEAILVIKTLTLYPAASRSSVNKVMNYKQTIFRVSATT